MSAERDTLGKCPHTKHGHGWCLRCLRALAPLGRELHVDRGAWEVSIGTVTGFGSCRVHAWQAAIERCEVDGIRYVCVAIARPCAMRAEVTP